VALTLLTWLIFFKFKVIITTASSILSANLVCFFFAGFRFSLFNRAASIFSTDPFTASPGRFPFLLSQCFPPPSPPSVFADSVHLLPPSLFPTYPLCGDQPRSLSPCHTCFFFCFLDLGVPLLSRPSQSPILVENAGRSSFSLPRPARPCKSTRLFSCVVPVLAFLRNSTPDPSTRSLHDIMNCHFSPA